MENISFVFVAIFNSSPRRRIFFYSSIFFGRFESWFVWWKSFPTDFINCTETRLLQNFCFMNFGTLNTKSVTVLSFSKTGGDPIETQEDCNVWYIPPGTNSAPPLYPPLLTTYDVIYFWYCNSELRMLFHISS